MFKRIKNNKFRLSRLLLSFLLLIVSTCEDNYLQVHAEECSITDWGYSIALKNPAYNMDYQGGFQVYTGALMYNGTPAYCIEPYKLVVIDEDIYETGSVSDYIGLSDDIKEKITEYSYFGYGYGERNDPAYYVATQILIHGAINNTFLDFETIFKGPMNAEGAISVEEYLTDKVKQYMREIEADVNAYRESMQEVNFEIKDESGTVKGNSGSVVSAEMKVGDTYTITDKNNALNKGRSLVENTFTTSSINENIITVKAEKNDINTTRKMVFKANNIEDLGFRPIVLASNNGQDVIVRGTLVSPTDASITINVLGTTTSIKKVDTNGNNVANAKLALYTSDNKLIKEWNSKDIAILEEVLVPGSYKIIEKEAPIGYVKSKGKDFVVSGEETNLEVVIKNFQIKALKVDDNNKPLTGVKLQVLDKNNKVVDSWTTTSEAHIINNLIEGETYKLHEESAPEGWELSDDITFVANEERSKEVIKMEDEHKSNLLIKKTDADTKTLYQGDASLVGATFTVTVNNKEIGKMIIDKNGQSNILNDISKDNTYKISETKVPDGYKKSKDINLSGKTIIEGRNEKYIYPVSLTNEIIRGGFKVTKKDSELKTNKTQGDATNLTTKFELINKSKYPVYVNNKEFKVNEVIMTFSTNKEGTYESNKYLLPYGTYLLKEIEAPLGYTNEGKTSNTFTIRKDGEIKDLTNEINNYLSRTTLIVQKRDFESKLSKPLGKASLKGAIFEIYNKSKNSIYYDNKLIEKDELITTIETDDNGQAKINDLPYGTYLVKEISAPLGYLPKGILEKTFVLHEEDGNTISKDSIEDSIQNEVIRGDFSLRKIDSETQEAMPNVSFKITSNTTGESHIFTTDENGYYTSEDSWNSHSSNTNNGGKEDGLWFGEFINENGDKKLVEVVTNKGALPYDEYTIEELAGEFNKGKKLYKGTLSIKRNDVTVNLNNIENDDIPKKEISIKTTATNKDGDKLISTTGKAVIVDKVSITNADSYLNEVVILEGTLIDKETKEVLQVNNIEFEIKDKSFEVQLPFEVNGEELIGKDIVVFEKLYKISKDNEGNIISEEELAKHEDINDEGQTVHFPNIKTSLKDSKTYSHNVAVSKEIVLEDTVKYENLIKGKTYEIKGILIDKKSGKEVKDIDGKEVTASKKFKAKDINGEEKLTFKFKVNSTSKTIVAFESLYYEGDIYAMHADINDENQTVYISSLKTQAKNKKDNKILAIGDKETIIDTVSYTNVEKDKRYIIKGELIDKTTNKKLNIKGESEIFKANNSNGEITIKFILDTNKLIGHEIVVYERLYEVIDGKEVLIAIHEDINDDSQTVTVEDPKPTPTPTITPKPEEPSTPVTVDIPKRKIPDTADNTNVVGNMICLISSIIVLITTITLKIKYR